MSSNVSKRPAEANEPSWVEWATGMVSGLLVILMIGWVAWEAFTDKAEDPSFTIAIKTRTAVPDGYRVTFEITNTAAKTASAVGVRGEIVDGDRAVEDADITFDYVPARSKSTGAILFSQDPGERQIRIRPIGYTEP